MDAAVEEIPYQELKIGNLIGSGFYGHVYSARWRNIEIAVKRIIPGRESRKIQREVNHLSRVSHVNIVKLYGISKDEDSFLMLMEYVDGGSLHKFLHEGSRPSYSHAHAFSWAYQIAQAVAYLHAITPHAVIHRDIKPLNALLCQKGLRLKVCDFGTVVDLSQSISQNAGTCKYKPPEVLDGLPFTEKCDVYSWAITFWEILSRKEPFEQHDGTFALSLAINGGERPPLNSITSCPEDVISLIDTCWSTNPQRRHTMELIAYIMERFVSEAGPIQPLDL
ncbi:mitogen-activated protein kinase kinase kinase 7 isoform X2 [Drosophila subpulchrella]|uniref:mitogen-activated protein kinase kinase kinase 7 isoform X2 n=1 Tax=Drosophila subpulchrella TaxID=1486046 RepID=UPI0018A150BF|nr:mitogen-activated protein kinase kinase kinase 7 isoform X2 [Drosophila subpulchrella]